MNLNRCSSLNELQEKYEFEKSMELISSLAAEKRIDASFQKIRNMKSPILKYREMHLYCFVQKKETTIIAQS